MPISNRVLYKLSSAVTLGLGLAAAVLLGFLLTEAKSLATVHPLATWAQAESHPGLITAVGRHLERDGVPFEVRGMNYYPKDYAWDRFWVSYTQTLPQITTELDLAKRLGGNTVRIFLPYERFDDSEKNVPYHGYLMDFIDRLRARDMVAIVTLFDFYPSASPAPYLETDYLSSTHHIDAVVNTLGITNPTILAWDAKNELDRDYDLFGETEAKAWAAAMIDHIKQLDPNHMVTLGFYGAVTGTLCYEPSVTETLVYSPAIAAEFSQTVDFVSMHYFLPERCYESDLQALQSQIGDKPLVLEEFGLHTQTTGGDPHTETEQAAYYDALLPLSEANNVAGYLFWTLNDLSYVPSGMQASHHCQGIVRNSLVNDCQVTTTLDYTGKPAVAVIRRHYDDRVAYLDLSHGWVDPNTDQPPPGWSDNWSGGGALLRGYNLSNLLWSHNLGKVAFSKSGILTTGLAFSPVLTNVDVDHYPILAGQVYSYSVRDSLNGSDAILYVGVRAGNHITRLLTITSDSLKVSPGISIPNYFRIDLRQPPLSWSGNHTFEIALELVPEAPENGYSATYEFDWIGIESVIACDALTDPIERKICQFVTGVYPNGILTDWPNPRLPGHFDHTPMRDYGEDQPAISESASMLALYAALLGDQATFDLLFDVSAPPEIGGTGAPMSSTRESPYYFASPNLCLLHWILDQDGDKKSGDGWLANAAGEENRWLEALSIADQKFPAPKYRLFANCLARGLMGATDFNPGAVGNFEDPGTPEEFDDYLMRPYFGWKDDFSAFAIGTWSNLSYNNLMGWRYAAQLGPPFTDFYNKVLSYTAPVMAGSVGHCGTDLPRVMYDVRRHLYASEILTPNLVCTMPVTATASSTQDQSLEYSPINAIDCITNTRWSSNFTNDEWIALEFSEPITLDGVILKWEAAFGKAYTIDVSNDGANWTPIFTETKGDGGDDVIHFPATTTRFVRMRGQERGLTPWGGYSLWEFKVYYGGGTSSLTALDLARRAAAYAKVSGDSDLWEVGQNILEWYKNRYPSSIAAAYDPCTGDPVPGWENGEWPSIMADLAELAAEYGDYCFARQVIEEKLYPFGGVVGPSAFENLEVLLALRHVAAATDVTIDKSVQPSILAAGAPLTYTLAYTNVGLGPATGILITDVMPVTLTHVSVISSSAQITSIGDISYTWQVEDLSPGESGVIIMTGIVSSSVSGVFSLTNRATITATDACFIDANPSDNVAVARNTVDAKRPEIVAKAPISGAVDVTITAPVVITFSESINTGTFTYSVEPDPGGWSETWNSSGTLVTLIHRPFACRMTHSITVVAADDLVGNSLSEAPYIWRFDTGICWVYLPLILKN